MARGRPKSLSQDMRNFVQYLWIEESMSYREIARIVGVSHMTIQRVLIG